MQYQIISAESIPNLEKFVNNEITHDWSPIGGLAIFLTESGDQMLPQPRTLFAQPMIRSSPQPNA